jgi:protein gp37
MGAKTKISWADATWNPIVGCSRISPGCANCFAESLALRYGWTPLPWLPANAAVNVILKPERLMQPLTWAIPRRVFVNSLSDLYHDLVPDAFIDDAYAVMAFGNWHVYQVLTKRPERMLAYLAAPDRAAKVHASLVRLAAARKRSVPPFAWPLPNVWQGVSIENDRWTRRADLLRAAPAVRRFISAEPLLGPLPSLNLAGIDQVIVGGESGSKARPMQLAWVRAIQTKARAQHCAFFAKQLGSVLARELGRPSKGDQLADWPADLRIQAEPPGAPPRP